MPSFEAGRSGVIAAELEEVPTSSLSKNLDSVSLEDHQAAADQGDMELAIERVRALIEAEPETLSSTSGWLNTPSGRTIRMSWFRPIWIWQVVWLGPGLRSRPRRCTSRFSPCLRATMEPRRAFRRWTEPRGRLPASQVASSEEYVDLGSMILGDDDGGHAHDGPWLPRPRRGTRKQTSPRCSASSRRRSPSMWPPTMWRLTTIWALPTWRWACSTRPSANSRRLSGLPPTTCPPMRSWEDVGWRWASRTWRSGPWTGP